MTDPADHAVPPGLADLPLEVRRAAEAAQRKEIVEGFDRQLLAAGKDEQLRKAVAFARLPDLAAKLRRD